MKARYDRWDAELTIIYAGEARSYDEDECDKLLRVIEHANGDPMDELSEFFSDEFGSHGYRVARWFVENACLIAHEVYE